MKTVDQILTEAANQAMKNIYGTSDLFEKIQVQHTKKEFDGDYSLVVFPLLSITKESPEASAEKLGKYIRDNVDFVDSFNAIGGFLNIKLSDDYWIQFLAEISENLIDFGFVPVDENSRPIVIEYSSPNTNKPMHLGHVRNNLIGWSIAEILKATGRKVVKVNLINDRGIHICKSMLAWEKWGQNITPEKAGMKGDELVGDFYVKFESEYKKQQQKLSNDGKSLEEARRDAPIIMEAQEMLKKWEDGDNTVRNLWGRMNDWVYEGFSTTYKRLGVDFDRIYYESDTYLLGKSMVEKAKGKGVFHEDKDGAIWADLSEFEIENKLLLRKDGTSVYITQDLGTARLRYDDYHPASMIYVVGSEQDHHFKVLQKILEKLNEPYASLIYHLSYGMVELPEGRMKSREGTVVDADNLIEEMVRSAEQMAKEHGKVDGLTEEEAKSLFENIGLGALKYFILKVDPKKKMLFDPKESIDFNGNTGPFVQYTYARIQSLKRRAVEFGVSEHRQELDYELSSKEKYLIKLISWFPQVVKNAGNDLNPALIANFAYELAKDFNQFYQEMPILKEAHKELAGFRLALSGVVGNIIGKAMFLLGINVPDKM